MSNWVMLVIGVLVVPHAVAVTGFLLGTAEIVSPLWLVVDVVASASAFGFAIWYELLVEDLT